MRATDILVVDRCFAHHDGAFGALCSGPGALAVSLTVPFELAEGVQIVARRAGPHWEFVGYYAQPFSAASEAASRP